jgi:hypothetical protein
MRESLLVEQNWKYAIGQAIDRQMKKRPSLHTVTTTKEACF